MPPTRPFNLKFAYRALTLLFLLLVTLATSAQFTAQQDEGGIPAYNAGPPVKGAKLPAILTKDQLWEPTPNIRTRLMPMNSRRRFRP